MSPKKSVAVWLIHAYEDRLLSGEVLLQQRSETETIDGVERTQSNPYVCQPTWNEKVEDRENTEDAIKRGAREELGVEFAENFDFQLVPFGVESFKYKGEDFTSFDFVGSISDKQSRLIKLHSGAMPNFIRVTSSTLPLISSKSLGFDPKFHMVLFDDQFKTLQKLFSLRGVLTHLA